MLEQPFELPADVALEKLKERIREDPMLAASTKGAALRDLAGSSPAAFSSLRASLNHPGAKNEADRTQSA